MGVNGGVWSACGVGEVWMEVWVEKGMEACERVWCGGGKDGLRGLHLHAEADGPVLAVGRLRLCRRVEVGVDDAVEVARHHVRHLWGGKGEIVGDGRVRCGAREGGAIGERRGERWRRREEARRERRRPGEAGGGGNATSRRVW